MIATVAFRRFKALRHTQVALGAFNLIVGPNSSGKTSLIEALLRLRALAPQPPVDAVTDFVATAAQGYKLNLSRLTAVGFSNGANIAATLLIFRPEVLGGAVLLRPMVVIDQPASTGALTGRRVLISTGNLDPIVPLDHPPRLSGLLRAGGAEVTVRTHPASHGLIPADLACGQEWFAAEKPVVR